MKFLQFLVFVFVFTSGFFQGQNKYDVEKKAQFFKLFKEQQNSVNYSLDNGQKLLTLSQTNYEKALSYMILGEANYKAGDYVKSVDFLEQAEKSVGKNDSLNAKFRIVNQLLISYRRAGLVENSDQELLELQKMVSQLKPHERDYVLLIAQAKIFEIDGEDCKAADVRKKFYDLMLNYPLDESFKTKYLFGVLSQLAFAEYKCGRIADAQKTVINSEKYKSKVDPKENLLLKDFYFMNKALLAHDEKNDELSRKYFDSAIVESELNKNNLVLKVILSERLEANIDTADQQLKYAHQIKNITDSETRVTKALISRESKKAFEIIKDREQKQMWLMIITSVVILSIGIGAYLYFRNLRKIKINYQKIIDELQDKSVTPQTEKPVENFVSDIKITTETEHSLLENLEKFEEKNLFTKNGISLAQMAVLLNTNTKYLNYILKKYRNTDFNNYINSARINFITKELHDNPKLRNYKISALAEKCGYSSHSQFASIFKAKTQISPSQFISILKQEEKV